MDTNLKSGASALDTTVCATSCKPNIFRMSSRQLVSNRIWPRWWNFMTSAGTRAPDPGQHTHTNRRAWDIGSRNSRETLNHFSVRRRIAETAFDVISRCRMTSMSSRAVGGGGGCSSAGQRLRHCISTNFARSGIREVRNPLRDDTPGGMPAAAADCGALPADAVTVASSSFRRTSTHPERTGRTELYTTTISTRRTKTLRTART